MFWSREFHQRFGPGLPSECVHHLHSMKRWKEVVFQASLDLSRANTHLFPGAEFPRVSTPHNLNCAASGDNVV